MVNFKSLSSFTLTSLLAVTSVSAFQNQIYLIRHGEKPSDDDEVGLSSMGMQRAQCLRNVFGASSGYNIKKIYAQTPKSDGKRRRPLDTVTPLANDLGLKVDISCDRDDPDCVKDSIDDYADANPKENSILICWEHDALGEIGDALGGKFDYPSSHFNYIYEIVDKDLTKNSPYSENCPGLDN